MVDGEWVRAGVDFGVESVQLYEATECILFRPTSEGVQVNVWSVARIKVAGWGMEGLSLRSMSGAPQVSILGL